MVDDSRQQLIGVRIAHVEQGETAVTRRVPGRVAVDETRFYRVNMAVEGWVQDVSSVTGGTAVRKDQLLLTYYAPEFAGAIQAYLYALGTMDRYQASAADISEQQITLTKTNIQVASDALRNLGMSDPQIEEIHTTRQSTKRIQVRAPVSGSVLARNVFPGMRAERGTELYRIADLGRVWIVADVFENEAEAFHPGATVTVSIPRRGRSFTARVANVPPQFDPASRTLKVRLEADNPGYLLRPDMYVDVELPVRLPSAITVAADAVLDSGLAKTVFVDKGDGVFERRAVQTGWRLGDRVEVTSGLAAGERVVVAGTFLLDSESRMRLGRAADAAPAPPPCHGPGAVQANPPTTATNEETSSAHEHHGHHD